jgi:hypothetical protein
MRDHQPLMFRADITRGHLSALFRPAGHWHSCTAHHTRRVITVHSLSAAVSGAVNTHRPSRSSGASREYARTLARSGAAAPIACGEARRRASLALRERPAPRDPAGPGQTRTRAVTDSDQVGLGSATGAGCCRGPPEAVSAGPDSDACSGRRTSDHGARGGAGARGATRRRALRGRWCASRCRHPLALGSVSGGHSPVSAYEQVRPLQAGNHVP